ncbi:MAG TPA: hypothetical protein VF939_08100 [Puia sp.]
MKSIRIKGLVIFFVLCFFFKNSFSQKDQPTPAYPRVAGFFAVLAPIGTITDKGFTGNFSNSTVIGFPIGLNLLKSDHLGYSMELVPFIVSQNGSSKMQYMLFHPGVMFRLNHGFTLIPRLAFQTDGRYGFTPVFSKIFIRKKDYQLYLSVSEPVRFGNKLPSSFTTALQVGITF